MASPGQDIAANADILFAPMSNVPSSGSPSRNDRPWLGRLMRFLAVLLFVAIGILTVPKIAPRMKQLFVRREARVQIADRAAGRSEQPPEKRARLVDVVWIVAVAAGGMLVLVPLGYFALRERKPTD
jgi:hypothetical protein